MKTLQGVKAWSRKKKKKKKKKKKQEKEETNTKKTEDIINSKNRSSVDRKLARTN